MWHPKLRGYMYQICEMFPCEEAEHGLRELHTYDSLEDAEKVMAVLESVNYNFTCYGIMLRPVWEQEAPKKECDHNGSTTTVTTAGGFSFSCPKCGERWVAERDANGCLDFGNVRYL